MSQDIVNENQKLSYTNLDFSSIYTEVLDMTKQLTKDWDPSISDESDPGVILVKLSALLADKCNYNIDKSILEAFPLSVTQDSNARQLYEQLGYYMHWYKAATVPVLLRWKQTSLDEEFYTIPKFSTVTNDDSTVVYTLVGTRGESDVVVSDGILYLDKNKTLEMIAYEGIPTSYTFNGTNVITPNMVDSNNRLYLESSYVFENGIFIKNTNQDNYSEWKRVDNLYEYSYNVHRYKFGYDGASNKCYLEFPDNYAELFGEGIEIVYLVFKSDEPFSNIPINYLSKFFTPLNVGNDDDEVGLTKEVVEISNNEISIGHADKEGLNEAYKNYKKTVGTFNTLTTLRDYLNYIKSQDLNICSNAIVTDRTNDVQSTYKILTKNNEIESLITQIEQSTDSFKYIKTKDEDVISNKTYFVEGNIKGVFTKVDNPTSDNINKYYECIGEDVLSPFSLKFYLLRNSLAITSGTEFNNSFKLTSDVIDMDSVLEGSSHLVHTFEDIEPLPDDIENDLLSRIIMIKNKYPISMNISTYNAVSYDDRLDIYRNIMMAFFKNLDSSNVEFGENVSLEYITDIATKADTRIKQVTFNTTESKSYAVYYNSKTNQYDEVLLPKSINNLITRLNAEHAEYNDILSTAIGKEIVCKSILQGTTQLLIPDDDFNYHLNQKFLEYRDEVRYLTGEAIIDMNNTDSSETYKVVDGDTTKTTNSYTLKENEVLTLFRPALKDDQEFTSGVHYDYNVYSDIGSGQSYQLKLGERFVFFTSNLDSSGKLESFTVYVFNEGSIISPTFDIPSRDRANLPEIIRTPDVSKAESSDYMYTESSVVQVNKINANAGISNTKIDTNESIKVQSLNRFTVVPEDGYRFLWVLNKPTYNANLKSYTLFDAYDSSNDTELENSEEINSYTLRSGEILCYTDPTMSTLGYVGAGTTIYRTCGTTSSDYTKLNSDDNADGQFVFVKWADIKTNNKFLGSGIGDYGPNKGGLYELSNRGEFVRTSDDYYIDNKDYYILLMKDTSGWYLSKSNSDGSEQTYYPASTPTTSVFKEIDLITDYADEEGNIALINPNEEGLYEVVSIEGKEVVDAYRLASKHCKSDNNEDIGTHYSEEGNHKNYVGKYKRYTNTLDNTPITSSFLIKEDGELLDTNDTSTFGNISLINNPYLPYQNKLVTKQGITNDKGQELLQLATIEDELFTSVDSSYNDTQRVSDRYFYKTNKNSSIYTYGGNNTSSGLECTDSHVNVINNKYVVAQRDCDTNIDMFNKINTDVKNTTLIDTDVSDYHLNKFTLDDQSILWDAYADKSTLDGKFVELSLDDIEMLPPNSYEVIGNNIHLGFKDNLTETSSRVWEDNSYYVYNKEDVSKYDKVTEADRTNYYKYELTNDTEVQREVKYYLSEQPLVSYMPVNDNTGSYVINNINNDPINRVKYTDKQYIINDLTQPLALSNLGLSNDVYALRNFVEVSTTNDSEKYYIRVNTSFKPISLYQAQEFIDAGTVKVYKSDSTFVQANTCTLLGCQMSYEADTNKLNLFTYDSSKLYTQVEDIGKYGITTSTYTGGLYNSSGSHINVGTTISPDIAYYALTGVTNVGENNGNLDIISYEVTEHSGVADSYGYVKVDTSATNYIYEDAISLVPNTSYYTEETVNSETTYKFKFYYDGIDAYKVVDGILQKDSTLIEGSFARINSGDTEYVRTDSEGNMGLVENSSVTYYYYQPNTMINSATSFVPVYVDNEGNKYYKPSSELDESLFNTLLDKGQFKPLTRTISTILLDSNNNSTDVQLTDYVYNTNLPSSSDFNASKLIKNLLLSKIGSTASGIFENTLVMNDAVAYIQVPSNTNKNTKPFNFNLYKMYGKNTYYNDGSSSSISSTYSTAYKLNSNGEVSNTINIARDYYIADGKSLTLNKVTCTQGGYVLVTNEYAQPGVEYFTPKSGLSFDSSNNLVSAKITCAPTKFAVGTNIKSSYGSGGTYIFKRLKPRDLGLYYKMSFSGKNGIDDAVNQFINNKSSGNVRTTNFKLYKRYYTCDLSGNPNVNNSIDYANLNPINFCKKIPYDITSKGLKILTQVSGINPAEKGLYVRKEATPLEWNMLHPSRYDKLYEKHSSIGCFVPLNCGIMDYSLSKYSGVDKPQFTPFVYSYYSEDIGGVGTSIGDKIYLPLSYTTFDTDFHVNGDKINAFDDVSDLLFNKSAEGTLSLTHIQATIDNINYDLINSDSLTYSYLKNLKSLSTWVSTLNMYFSEYTTGVYYMPHWYELKPWYKFVDKKYYVPLKYLHKNVKGIPALSCADAGGVDIVKAPLDTLVKLFAQVQPNTSLTFTQNEMTMLSDGDIITISTDDRYGENRELPVFSNDITKLDLDSYEISYQRKGDAYVSVDKITIDDCYWEAYSNLKINSNGTNGQKLLSNHTLTAYTLNNEGKTIQLGDVIKCNNGNYNVHFQLKNPIISSVGSFIDVSTKDDLTSEDVTLNKLYVYNVSLDADRYSYSSEYDTLLQFKKITGNKEDEGVDTIYIGIKDNSITASDKGDIVIPQGKYLLPINGVSDIKLTLKYVCQVSGNPYKIGSDGQIQELNTTVEFEHIIPINSYIDNKDYFLGDKLHFGLLDIPSVIEKSFSEYTHVNNLHILNGYIIATIDKPTNEDSLTIVINDVFKFEENELFEDKFNDIKDKLSQLDYNQKFNYTHIVKEDDLIEDPLTPNSYWDKGHPYNAFTIPQLDIDRISYTFNKTIT